MIPRPPACQEETGTIIHVGGDTSQHPLNVTGTVPLESYDNSGVANLIQFALGGNATDPADNGLQIVFDAGDGVVGDPMLLTIAVRQGTVFAGIPHPPRPSAASPITSKARSTLPGGRCRLKRSRRHSMATGRPAHRPATNCTPSACPHPPGIPASCGFGFRWSRNHDIHPENPAHRMMPVIPNKLPIAILVAALAALGSHAPSAEIIPPSQSAADPAKGEVSESGKFIPRVNGDALEPAPDPAARLDEIGITADQETVRIGAVELDRKALTVTIPAAVNMLEGAVEYFLVHENGKIHESVFATRAKPEDIHVACLLAGWEPAGKPVDIDIMVTWETNGPPRNHRAEELVAIAAEHPSARDGRRIEDGPWHYTGSLIDAAGFVATREGSIIALIADPASLLGNPRPGRIDDSLHVPNRDLLPAQGHPVRIILSRSLPREKPKPDSQ